MPVTHIAHIFYMGLWVWYTCTRNRPAKSMALLPAYAKIAIQNLDTVKSTCTKLYF